MEPHSHVYPAVQHLALTPAKLASLALGHGAAPVISVGYTALGKS